MLEQWWSPASVVPSLWHNSEFCSSVAWFPTCCLKKRNIQLKYILNPKSNEYCKTEDTTSDVQSYCKCLTFNSETLPPVFIDFLLFSVWHPASRFLHPFSRLIIHSTWNFGEKYIEQSFQLTLIKEFITENNIEYMELYYSIQILNSVIVVKFKVN